VSDLDPVRRPGEFVLSHDHLLVPAERADEAIEVLCALRY
jgi:hypothetical protein